MRYSSLALNDSELSRVNVWQPTVAFSQVATIQRATVGVEELCLRLADGSAAVGDCRADSMDFYWRSPKDWRVQEAFFSDLDHDGVQDLALLVWRAFNPWPVDRYLPQGGRINAFQDLEGNSCHLILVSLEDGNYRETWAGSALARPIRSLIAADLNGDNLQELAAIEYSYNDTSSIGGIVVWRWSGFGFSLVDRVEGAFSSLNALQQDQRVILVGLND